MRKLFPSIIVALLLTVGWVIVSQVAPPEADAEKAVASVAAVPLRQTVPITISIDPASKTVVSGTYDFLWNIKGESGADGAEMSASPEVAAFIEKFDELTEPGGANEVWTLAE